MKSFSTFTIATTLALITVFFSAATKKVQNEEWISLFNGKDISNWFVKIQHHETGDNFGIRSAWKMALLKCATINTIHSTNSSGICILNNPTPTII